MSDSREVIGNAANQQIDSIMIHEILGFPSGGVRPTFQAAASPGPISASQREAGSRVADGVVDAKGVRWRECLHDSGTCGSGFRHGNLPREIVPWREASPQELRQG